MTQLIVDNGQERRTDGLLNHLGKAILGELVVTRKVTLPAASITTEEIQPSATQQMIGSYVQTLSWTLSQANAWTETPIGVNVAFSGVPTRLEFTVFLGCPTKGQRVVWGIMLDGASPLIPLGAVDAPEAGYGSMASGVYYFTPTPGVHRIGFGLYGPVGAQIYNALPSTLYVTEQKR